MVKMKVQMTVNVAAVDDDGAGHHEEMLTMLTFLSLVIMPTT